MSIILRITEYRVYANVLKLPFLMITILRMTTKMVREENMSAIEQQRGTHVSIPVNGQLVTEY